MSAQRRYRGIHTARLFNIVLTRPPVRLLFPLGGYLQTYDPLSLRKLSEHYLFDDIILCLLQLPLSEHLIALSYSGSGALTSLTGEILHTLHTEVGIVTRASVNSTGSFLATCAEFGNFNGIIEVWSVSLTTGFSRLYRAAGNYSTCDFTSSNALFTLRMSPIHIKGQSNLLKNHPIPLSQATIDFPPEPDPSQHDLNTDLETHEVRECTYYACNYTLEGDRRAVETGVIAGLVCSQVCNDVFVGVFQGRVIVGMNVNTLEKLFTVQIRGGSVLQSVVFTSPHTILFSPSSGLICELDITAPLPYDIDLKSGPYDCLSVRNMHKDWFNSDSCYINILDSMLISFDDCNIYSGLIANEEIVHEERIGELQLSACGVALNSAGNYVAVGDLSGQLHVYSTEDRRTGDRKYSVEMFSEAISVRSLLWSKYMDVLVIGTLAGFIFTVKTPENEGSELKLALECPHGVTVIREKEVGGTVMIAVGTVGGEVVLLTCQSTGELTVLKSFLAHRPQEGFDSSSYFGSLRHFSEVWSLSWAPAAYALATSSEDQTVVVWDVETENALVTLPKHRRAVTAVDWKVLSTGQERLISCSDDRSVRVYETTNWQLLHTFWTTVIREWHTLTYAVIDAERNQAAVVSQNGYLFLFDLKEYEVKYGKKIHYGSAEGLSLQGDLLATCSSECSVCISRLD